MKSKKWLLITIALVFIASMASAAYVEIGTGTDYEPRYGPFYNYYENNRTQTLYLQSELGAAQTYTHISFDIERVAPAGYRDLVDFTINFLHTDSTELIPGAFYDMTGSTQVFFSSSYTLATTTGWTDIDITDFAYNGTQNLIVEVIWGDQGGYTSTYYRNYKTSSTGTCRMLVGYADSQTPPNYNAAYEAYSNMRFHYIPAGAPGMPTNPNPIDLASGVSINTGLAWTNGANTDSVEVLFDTVDPPVNSVYDGVAVESLTNAQIGGPLSYGETYYWQVIAKNSAKLETAGPIWSFTTEYDTYPLPVTDDFEPTFDKFDNVAGNNVDWVLNDTLFTSTTHSAHNPYGANNENILMLTGMIDLTAKVNATLKFWHIAKTEGDLTVIITTSEPMETLQLEILSLGFNSSGSPVNSNRTEWEFLVPESTVTGAHILSIDGYDYANTQIESLNSTLTSYTVPTRDVNGNWIPDNPGLDTRHMFSSQLTLIEFIASENVICPGDEVTFTNLSAGYDDTYEWDWRFYYSTGGGCGVSNLINPEPYTYPLETAFGFYDVVVRIYEPGIGLVDKMTKEDFIEVVDPSTFLDADFDAEIDGNKGQLYGNSPLTVNFTDISTGTPNTWNWDFDGNYGSSSLQNPTFTYENNTSEAIQYSVSLVTCNNTNCDEIVKENLITVYPEGVPQNPIANFTYNQPSILSPSYVSFTNTSSGIITNYSWYIDNIEVSDDQTLSPRFFNTTSIVKLLVSDGTNSDQIERTISVYNNPGSGVMADFTWEPEEIIKGDFVMFCENVSGFYYNYYCNWIFEEPRTGYVWTSFMHNPTEIFTEAGIYKVTLEVYDTWDFINLIGVCQKNVEVISQNGFPTLADNEFNGGDPPASDGANDYGISVAINDNFAFVGASAWGYADHRDGWVFVYEFDEINETWSEFQTLISPENNDWWSDEFGFDIDVSNEWLVIGAPGHNWNQPPTGIAYVYKYLKSATTY